MNKKTIHYQIASLWLRVEMPGNLNPDVLLPTFVGFKGTSPGDEKLLCAIDVHISDIEEIPLSARLLAEIPNLMEAKIQMFETDSHYIIALTNEEGVYSLMKSNKDFSISDIYLHLDKQHYENIMTPFLMIAFSQSAIHRNTVLMHTSVVEKDGMGYAFLGKSGTGKSTHSALWMRHIEGVQLLNDDNPAVRVEDDGSICVYGTPWSGKTPCYINKRARLKALVRLQQAPENQFEKIEGAGAMIALLPSCSSMRWNDKSYSALCDILEEIIRKSVIAQLKCLPNEEAAKLCYREIQKITKQQ